MRVSLLILPALAGFLTLIPSHVGFAQGSGVCVGLTGAARTACLKAEVERGRRETADIDRRNRDLDRAKTVVCTVTRSSAAGAVGGMVGDKALGQNRACTPRAR